jgi:hypothetical protein
MQQPYITRTSTAALVVEASRKGWLVLALPPPMLPLSPLPLLRRHTRSLWNHAPHKAAISELNDTQKTLM